MSDRPSLAKDLYDRILVHDGHPDSVSFLRAMVGSEPPTTETAYLDFKGASTPSGPIGDGEIKRTWSEALAGFATTSGGVLIWGIDARKNAGSTVDAAVGLNPVVDPNGFRSRLQQLLHQATDPPVPGVLIDAFSDTLQSSTAPVGFVVCFVPESDYKPHRTETGGKRWVMRIGDSFIDIPPPVLRSLFFPQRNSYIFLRAARVGEAAFPPGVPRVATARFQVRAYNEGPATADNAMFLLKMLHNWEARPLTRCAHGRTRTGYSFQPVDPFHPGQMLELCEITVPFQIRSYSSADDPVDYFDDVQFDFQIYASDQMPKRVTITMSQDDVHFSQERIALPALLPVDRFR
jgi:hypothetical protein